MTDLRTAAQQALAWLGPDSPECCGCREEWQQAIDVLRAALAEEALQRLTDVQQEMERNFCPRCGKRTNDIHTCTPPHEEHFCDTHCTWADHAPGCVRAEPVAWYHVPYPGNSPMVSLRQQHEPSMYGAVMPLYLAPPQRKPLSGLEVERLLEQVIGSLPAARRLVRAIERAHGICE